jgi:hypothetical protein
MMKSKAIDLDTTKFNDAFRRFMASSKRAAGVALKEQAKGVLRKIIDWTPPGGKNAQGSAAKKRGEVKVESDILKLMQPYKRPADANILRAAGMMVEEASSQSPASIHKLNRTRTGRVRRKISPRIKIKASDLGRYIASKKKMVGFLASGWKEAATKLGLPVPAWISRHSAPGVGRIKSDAASIEVVATNKVKNAPKLDMERRVQNALDSQADSMIRRLENFAIREAAKRAGFKT